RLPAGARRGAAHPSRGQPGGGRRRTARAARRGGQGVRDPHPRRDAHRGGAGRLVPGEHGGVQVPADRRVPGQPADDRHRQDPQAGAGGAGSHMTDRAETSIAEAAADAINAGIGLVGVPPRRVAGWWAAALARSRGRLSRGGELAGELARVAAGRSPLAPAGSDRRFTDPAWSRHPLYRRLGQAYLALERTITDAVEQSEADWRTRERARFGAGIVASALAPTNTLLGNPAALRRAAGTRGRSLLHGARNLLTDLATNRGMPRQVDARPFRGGETVGVTPGQVAFRHEVVEIIESAPATPAVRSVPLLLVWSLINRFYVLDLAPGRSFVEYAVSRGIRVFATSWRNPTRAQAHWDLDTYAQALLEAMDAVREISGSDQLGTIGLCAGGQLLAGTLAILAERGDDRVA